MCQETQLVFVPNTLRDKERFVIGVVIGSFGRVSETPRQDISLTTTRNNTMKIYTANSSIVWPEHKKFTTSRRVNFQWLWDKDVGTQNWNKIMFYLSNRPSEYNRSLHPEDIDWDVHNQTVLEHMELRKDKNKTIYSGQAHEYGKRGKYIGFTSGLLVYDKAYDIYNFTVNIANPSSPKEHNWNAKLTLKPQTVKDYPYRGEYRNDNASTVTGVTLISWI